MKAHWYRLGKTNWWMKFPKNLNHPHYWRGCFKHECKKGVFKGVTGFQYYIGKKKKAVYGYCGGCKEKFPPTVKTIIFFNQLD